MVKNITNRWMQTVEADSHFNDQWMVINLKSQSVEISIISKFLRAERCLLQDKYEWCSIIV